MKKKATGFSLIELLAVIVVLAIIALIATPIILRTVENAKKEAFKDSVYGIIDAAEQYYSKSILKGSQPSTKQFSFPSDTNLQFNGKRPTAGFVTLNAEGKILVKLYDGTYCAEKDYDQVEVTLKKSTKEDCFPVTLKSMVESNANVLTGIKVNGKIVNKVIGTKTESKDIKNWIWYSGQLWQIIETTDTYVKMIAADNVTVIAYGSTSEWNNSWVRKWLNEINSSSTQDGIFYNNLSQTDLLLNGEFCLDEPINVTVESSKITNFTPINSCENIATDKIGLMTFEDYAYSLDGNGINGAKGGSFIDIGQSFYSLTKYTVGGETKKVWYTSSSSTASSLIYGNTATATTDQKAYGVRPVIFISADTKIKTSNDANYGTLANPYRLEDEIVLTSGQSLNNASVGSFIYISEANSPSTATEEIIRQDLTYTYNKNQVRYRIIGKNSDGTIKIRRADVLRGLPSYVTNDTNGVLVVYYALNISGQNYFSTYGNGGYGYTENETLGYFLNNTTNGYYSWLSTQVKNKVADYNWNLPVVNYDSLGDYTSVLFNTSTSGSYPSRTNDGKVSAKVGLPQYADMFSAPAKANIWLINRQAGSTTDVMTISASIGLGHSQSYTQKAILPILNLKTNILISGGDGTPNNPYTLNLS